MTCEVDPPYTRIEVTDDGQGLSGEASEGRYGLAIMSERAERIRGSLEIRPHQPHGTTVAVVLNAGARPTPRAEAPGPGPRLGRPPTAPELNSRPDGQTTVVAVAANEERHA
nr:hypothetical protein GCM10025732_22320 [Glycomyces mayteni]